MSKKVFLILVLTCLLVAGLCTDAEAAFETERTDGSYFTLVDENGKVLHKTSLPVYAGDEFIDPDNRRFKVTKIEGLTCYCRLAGIEDMPQVAQMPAKKSFFGLTPVFAGARPLVGIYHTHSDESYVPSDGKESIRGKGGIFDVGRILSAKLKNLGLRVWHDTTPHDPHDANAYYRSRRTAAKLLRNGAQVLIDVHRDSVPEDVYSAKVKGEKVTKVKLVVGRQNPHMAANLAFAKKIKAYLDKNEPGLSAGIFLGKGNYNQDLTSRALLIEVGAHTNSKNAAEKGVAYFAEIVPQVLELEPQATSAVSAGKGENKGYATSILVIILVAGLAYGAYLAINRGKAKNR